MKSKLIEQLEKLSGKKVFLKENLDVKYQSDDVYKYAVKSKYVIGFQGREDVLYFKSEEEAKNYVNQKPTMREYLGVKSVLKEDKKSPGQLQVGDIIVLPTRRGKERFILLTDTSWGRSAVRTDAVLERDKEKYKTGESHNYFGLKLRPGDYYEVVGKVNPNELEEIRTGQKKIVDAIHAKKKERTDVLHGKWNPEPGEPKEGVLGWESDGRRQKLTLQNGDVVHAGDTVAVQFSNGVFNMTLGNERGVIANFSEWSSKTGMIFVKNDFRQKARSVPYQKILRRV